MSPVCSGMVWITCSMVSALPLSFRQRWFIALCVAAVLCSLVTHLTADVAGFPLELKRLACEHLLNEHVTHCDLLGEVALLAAAITISLASLACLINIPNLKLFNWILPPLVRPPIALH